MISHPMSFNTQHDDDELELPVEAVAERLGLPAAMLIRRIEAGDIPARQVQDVDGFHYRVRIGELGSMLPEDDEEAQEITGTAAPMIRNGEVAQAMSEAAEVEVVDDAARIADDDTLAVAEDLDAMLPPPPQRAAVEVQPLDSGAGPRAELAMMNLDPRELVAGLLDRWERTLEQRIYAEQRQRFEAELTNRQAKVKQLQLELDAVRAEHAAALAEKERQLAERHRELAEREREVVELRTQPRRRGWLFGR